MTLWLTLAVNSIAFGGLPFLLSARFSLMFGLVPISNLMHGPFFMLGAYFGVTLLAARGPISRLRRWRAPSLWRSLGAAWSAFIATSGGPRNSPTYLSASRQTRRPGACQSRQPRRSPTA